MLTQKLRYREGDAHLTGSLTRDDASSAPKPGVLIIHGGAGLDAHAEKQARRLADAGYVTFACDMYGDGVTGNRERVLAQINAFRTDRGRLAARATAGLDVLRAQPQIDGRIAAVGYCFGGLVALELARAGVELVGSISVHGTLTTTQPVQAGAIKTPILVCQGALDPHCTLKDVAVFADEMKACGVDWEMVIYGNAMHGFTHEDARGQMPGVLYEPDADIRSLSAIRAFLNRTLERRV